VFKWNPHLCVFLGEIDERKSTSLSLSLELVKAGGCNFSFPCDSSRNSRPFSKRPLTDIQDSVYISPHLTWWAYCSVACTVCHCHFTHFVNFLNRGYEQRVGVGVFADTFSFPSRQVRWTRVGAKQGWTVILTRGPDGPTAEWSWPDSLTTKNCTAKTAKEPSISCCLAVTYDLDIASCGPRVRVTIKFGGYTVDGRI
jgi:hypothetical protein